MVNPMSVETENYADIRDAVAKLCGPFPGEYRRRLDREMADPTEFVKALAEAVWLSGLILDEYGGAGLSKHILGLPRSC